MHLGTQHCKLHSLFVFSKRVYTHCPHDTTWGSIFTLEKRVNAINETEIILISVRRKTLRWGDIRNAPEAPAVRTTLPFCVFWKGLYSLPTRHDMGAHSSLRKRRKIERTKSSRNGSATRAGPAWLLEL